MAVKGAVQHGPERGIDPPQTNSASALLIPLKMKADKSGGDGQFPEAHARNLETPAAARTISFAAHRDRDRGKLIRACPSALDRCEGGRLFDMGVGFTGACRRGTSPPALAGGKGMRIARSAEEVREGFLAGR
jgi:hypothetical protein